jgi:tryptophan-rich sensory protein
MGLSLFFVWRRTDHPNFKVAFIFFFVQFILNILWSVFFFGLRSPVLGLVDIALLWIAILFTILNFLQISRFAGILLIPYFLWVSFAALLNFFLWILNR